MSAANPLTDLCKEYVRLSAALLVADDEPEQDQLLEKLDEVWYKMTPDEQQDVDKHISGVLARTTPPPVSEF